MGFSGKLPKLNKLFINLANPTIFYYDILENLYINESIYLNRNVIVNQNMVGLDVDIHNGRYLVNIDIKENMVGHKLGEFSITKALGKRIHRKKLTKKSKKK